MSALTSWDQGSGRFPRLGGLGMEAGGWVGEWLGEVGAVSGSGHQRSVSVSSLWSPLLGRAGDADKTRHSTRGGGQ